MDKIIYFQIQPHEVSGYYYQHLSGYDARVDMWLTAGVKFQKEAPNLPSISIYYQSFLHYLALFCPRKEQL